MCAMESRFARNLIAGLGLLVLLAAFPATAQKGGQRLDQRVPGRPMPPQQVPASDTGAQPRDAHVEGRMTPEQRQQLRRDVHSHGRDIYHRQHPGAKQP
jgi:hypothetical protein